MKKTFRSFGLVFLLALVLTACSNKLIKREIPAELSDEFGFITEEFTGEYIEREEVDGEGNRTVYIKESRYGEFTESFRTKIEGFFSELEASSTENIDLIEFEEDLSKVVLVIDGDKTDQDQYGSLLIGMYVASYRAYAGEDPNFTMEIKDKATGNLIESLVFPGLDL